MKHLTVLLACFAVSTLFSQFEWGAKFGSSFPSETDLLKIVRETDQLNKLENSITGWQFGFYGKIMLSSIYLRPELQYTTDNAAMIGIVGYLKYYTSKLSDLKSSPLPRYSF